MITIISGTNRPNSRTRLVADAIHDMLIHTMEDEISQVNLEDVSTDMYHEEMYSADQQHSQLSAIQDEAIIPADLWVVVSPEYNGSFSGALKVFIDALSVRRYAETFRGKKVALVGVAAGRAGNLRGMEHLTGLFNYLGMTVYPDKLPISSIEKQIEDGKLNDSSQEALTKWSDGLKKF